MSSPWADLIDQLRSRGLEFAPGLTDAEVAAAESRFEFRFPPDLREFLQTALPHGPSFPDWRAGNEVALREWLDLPRDGVLFDVECNGFWLPEWGPRPETEEAKRVVEQLLRDAPRLIPIYSHRMLPADPPVAGNPVFSVHQTDIIVYGSDLRDYLMHEFLRHSGDWSMPEKNRPIAFWGVERFQAVRWGTDGSYGFDNRGGVLPEQ
jgi:hypothetical protein